MTLEKLNPTDDRPCDSKTLWEEHHCAAGSRRSPRSVNQSSHNENGTWITLFRLRPIRCLQSDGSELNSTTRTSRNFQNILESVRTKSDFKLDKLDRPVIQDVTHEDLKNSANVQPRPIRKRQRFTDGSSHFNVKASRPVDSVRHTDAEPHISSSSENQASVTDHSRVENILQRCFKKAIDEVLREQSCSASEMLNCRIPTGETGNVRTEQQHESQNSQARKRWARFHQTTHPPSCKPKPSPFSYRSEKPECDKFHPIPLQFDQMEAKPTDSRRSMRYPKVKNAFEIRKTKTDRMLDRRLAALYKKLLPKRTNSKQSVKQNIPHWVDKFGGQFAKLKKPIPRYRNATLSTIRRAKATLEYLRGLKHGRRSPRYLMMANTRHQIPSNLEWEAQEKLKLQNQNNKVMRDCSCRLDQDLTYDSVSSRSRQNSPYSARSPLQNSSMADKIGDFDERKTLNEILKKLASPVGKLSSLADSKHDKGLLIDKEPRHAKYSSYTRFTESPSETQYNPVKCEICNDLVEVGALKSHHANFHSNNCLRIHQDRDIPDSSTHESLTSLGKRRGSRHQGCSVCKASVKEHSSFGLQEYANLNAGYNRWIEKMLSRYRS